MKTKAEELAKHFEVNELEDRFEMKPWLGCFVNCDPSQTNCNDLCI